jgi:uncharacterized membrane protein YkoI
MWAGPAFGIASAQDQDQARAAVQAGEVRSLHEVLVEVRRMVPGEVLDAQLKSGPGGELLYQIRVLTPNGEVKDVVVDAGR